MVRLFLSNKNRPTALLFVVATLLLLSSCAPYQARKKPFHFHSDGTASWYGPGFHGRKTASGERYNQRDMTAAHRTLPFGTMLKVTNIDNGKSVIVRINDRGPFIRGRIIDLSKSAAERIGMMGAGTAPVKLASLSGSGKRSADSTEAAADEDEGMDAAATDGNGVSALITKSRKKGTQPTPSIEDDFGDINTESAPPEEKITKRIRPVKEKPAKKVAPASAPAGSGTGNIPEDESF